MRSPLVAASILMLASSVLACAQPESTDDESVDEPARQVMSGHGSGGTNGLTYLDYQAFKIALAKAARTQTLVDPGTMNVSHGIATTFLAQGSGAANLLHYAVACTVPDGKAILVGNEWMLGRGHVAGGEKWLQGPLDPKVIVNLMACVTAHVNPLNKEVDILLAGENIVDDVGNPDLEKFDISEALWTAKVNIDDMTVITVWPSKRVYERCGNSTDDAFRDRVCGQWPGWCNLEIGDPGVCNRDAETGNWYCDNNPVIETRLTEDGFGFMYPQICGGGGGGGGGGN